MDKKQAANELERRRPTFLKIGLIAGMALALMAFEYTTYKPTPKYLGELVSVEIDRELPPSVIRKEEKKEVKKEKDPNRFNVQEEPIVEPEPDPEPELKDPDPDLKLFSLDSIDGTEELGGEGPLPETEFIVVENMPHFKECAQGTETERRTCTQVRFIEHLSNNIRVPEDVYFSEKAYVSFVVNAKGKVSKVAIKNEVSRGLEKEIKRVFALYPELVPGKQRGKPVSVIYTIPVSIKVK